MTRAERAHDETRGAALVHFNATFRKRYGLPALTEPWLAQQDDIDELWEQIYSIRADGVGDPSCAILARIALTRAPRYAIGFVDGADRVHVFAPDTGDDAAFRSHHVLLVNPLGGADNWREVARWVRKVGGNDARRMLLAGLASERRPDLDEIDQLLRGTSADRKAQILPPDEAFSTALAAEVSFIYDIPIETLRAWKQRLRREHAAKRAGRPTNR